MRSRAAREDGDWRASVYSVPAATKRFAWKKRRLQKKGQMGPAFDFLEVKYYKLLEMNFFFSPKTFLGVDKQTF